MEVETQRTGRDPPRTRPGDRGGQSTAKKAKIVEQQSASGAGGADEGEDEEVFQDCAEAADGYGGTLPLPLHNKFSDDLAVNMAITFQSMLFTWKWKEITWMLRIRKATRDEFGSRARWKRNPRWLMALLAKQIAFMWGHLGSLRQTMNNSKHLHLMRARSQ